jgi:serine protease Do
MTKNEKRLLVGFIVGGGLLFMATAMVAVGLLAVGLGWVSLDRTAKVDRATEAPVALVVPTPAQENSKDSTSLLDRLRGQSNATRDKNASAGTIERAPILSDPKVDLGADLSALYDAANPGVVSLIVTQNNPLMGGTATGAGSGFVYDAQHIITNNHVVNGAQDIEVLFFDGDRRTATVVGTDVYSDLAVVKVDDMPPTARALTIVADFNALKVGQPVVAIGNPFNKNNSMSFGIISALGRTMPDGATSFAIPQTIQTDAAINPGNSGGPLLNLRGEVIGVNAQINTTNFSAGGTPGNSGVGFAIPASIVAKVAPALIAKGSYAWPYLGVTGGSIGVETAKANNLPDTHGAYISCVQGAGPSNGQLDGAENMQFSADCQRASSTTGDEVPRGGDVVVAIDGTEVKSFDDLLSYIALETQPGQKVRLTVLRDGKEQDVEVTLGNRQDMPQQQEQNQ